MAACAQQEPHGEGRSWLVTSETKSVSFTVRQSKLFGRVAESMYSEGGLVMM